MSPEPVSSNNDCQLTIFAGQKFSANDAAMSRRKRGDKDRTLDPLVKRAITRIVAHCEERNISAAQLARDSGVDAPGISRILSGQNPEVAFFRLVRIAHAAGLAIDWLLMDPPPPLTAPTAPPESDIVPMSRRADSK